MLINFTNHPAARWSEAQRMAARQYGAVVDLPFPEVDPTANETSLDAIASLYVRRILAMAPDAVLCQGNAPWSTASPGCCWPKVCRCWRPAPGGRA